MSRNEPHLPESWARSILVYWSVVKDFSTTLGRRVDFRKLFKSFCELWKEKCIFKVFGAPPQTRLQGEGVYSVPPGPPAGFQFWPPIFYLRMIALLGLQALGKHRELLLLTVSWRLIMCRTMLRWLTILRLLSFLLTCVFFVRLVCFQQLLVPRRNEALGFVQRMVWGSKIVKRKKKKDLAKFLSNFAMPAGLPVR